MFNSEILDVSIGLIFVYLFLSILCSVIIEMATSNQGREGSQKGLR